MNMGPIRFGPPVKFFASIVTEAFLHFTFISDAASGLTANKRTRWLENEREIQILHEANPRESKGIQGQESRITKSLSRGKGAPL